MSETDPIAPHGGTLVDLLAKGDKAADLAAEAANLPKRRDQRARAVRPRDARRRRAVPAHRFPERGRLPLGAGDHAPRRTACPGRSRSCSVSATTTSTASAAPTRSRCSPAEGADAVAVLRVSGQFKRDKHKEALSVYRTDDMEHPGVKAMYDSGDTCVAGTLEVIALPPHDDFVQLPADARRDARRRSASAAGRRVVGFQTRNPIHRAHEYIQKCALEIVDGLMVHPLMGATKADDVPPDVRMRCYEALFGGYYPQDRAMISVFPAAMRYAGPREAIWHAIARKNYGCTHFIVGRDHAGRRLLLRHVRRAEDLRRVRAGRARHPAADVRALVLVQQVRGYGLAEDLSARGRGPRVPVGHEGARDAARRASARRWSSAVPRSPTS